MTIYNLLHTFLRGDLIWSAPTVMAGVIAIAPSLFPARRLARLLVFLVVFLALAVGLHLLLDPAIHNFQDWWMRPMGPGLQLTP